MALQDILKAALFTPFGNERWGLPLLLEGEPGIGKSAIIEQICAANGLECETLTASDRDPTDFSGLPFPDREHKHVTRLVEGWMHDMFSSKRKVVFIDELSTVAGSVQAVLLRGVRSGVWAGREAPKGVRFIAAMNPSEIASGGHKISQPLANRFGWIDFPPPTPDQWGAYMMGAGQDVVRQTDTNRNRIKSAAKAPSLDPEAEEQRVLDRWTEEYARTTGLMVAATRALPHVMLNKPKNNDPAASKAWSSPRTLEYATRALASASIHALSEVDTDIFFSSFVGDAVAMEISKFRHQQDLPDPGRVLDGKEKFKHDKKRIDRTWAVLAGCTTLVASPAAKDRKKRATALWEILSEVADDAADLVLKPVNILISKQLISLHKETSMKLLEKLDPIVTAADIHWSGEQDSSTL